MGGVGAVSVGHEYMFGTRGSDIMYSGGVCEMYMSLARGVWEVRVVRGLGLDFINPLGTRGVLDMCLCLGCGSVGCVGGDWVGVLGPESGRVR